MATKSNLIANFRASVQTMLGGYSRALELANQATLLDWDEAALTGAFAASSDITVAEFIAAMAVIKKLDVDQSGVFKSAALAKMGG